MSGKRWIWAMAVIAVAGCHHDNSPAPDRADAFGSQPAIPPTAQFVTAQAATGARADATLRPVHFDDGQLNSLGRQKLDLMTRAEDASSSQRIVVYLDLPPDGPVNLAHKSVADFLKSVGMSDAQIRIEDGPNPASTSPAAKSINDLHRLSEDKKSAQDYSTGTPATAPPMGNALKDLANH